LPLVAVVELGVEHVGKGAGGLGGHELGDAATKEGPVQAGARRATK
jgi:hypothetical protein